MINSTKIPTSLWMLTLIAVFAFKPISAQYTMSGPTSAAVNSTNTYSISNASTLLGRNWSVSNVSYTIVSGQGTPTANIKFTSGGYSIVNFSAVTPGSYNSVYLSKSVQVGNPVGQVSITSGPTSRCKGSGTTDYNASATNATSYSWSISPSSAGTINSAGTVSWSSTYSGTASVTVTAYGDGNSTTANRAVNVIAQPSSPPLSADDSTVCDTGTTTVRLSGSAQGISYTLYKNGTSVSSKISTYFGEPLNWNVGAGSYYVRASDPGNSCGQGPATPTVTVTSQQGLGSSIVLNNLDSTTRCPGSGTTDFQVTGGSSGNTYVWSVSGGGTLSGSGRNATMTWNSGFSNSAATITVQITSQCGTQTTRTSTVTVEGPPPSSPPLSADDSTVCDTGTTTVRLSGSAQGISYALYKDGIEISSKISSFHGEQLNWNVGVGSYYVRASDPGNSCGIGPATPTIVVSPGAPVAIEVTTVPADLSNVCVGSTVTLTATNGSGHQWSTGETGNQIDVVLTSLSTMTFEVIAYEPNCNQLRSKSISITPNSSISWYYDGDGDGLGDYFGTPTFQCDSPGANWVTNNDDLCPDDFGTAANSGCLAGSTPEDRNWISTTSYDINGVLKESSISYFDDLGKLEQRQSLDIATDRVWASQVLFDQHGRAALNSLSAPIENSGNFLYENGFIENEMGSQFTLSDFENTSLDPAKVGNSMGTLGWYYSELNTDSFFQGNSYQDVTDRPYIRSIYSNLNPGSILGQIGGNKVDTNGNGSIDSGDGWPQTYSFTMPASDELSLDTAFGNISYSDIKTVKTIMRDAHGNENVFFSDTDGKILAAARSGGPTTSANMNLYIGNLGYVDIHIPYGVTGISSSDESALDVFDLITETKLVQSLGTLSSGFYRISVKDLDTYLPGSIFVSYQVNYYDYSLNEYDERSRLVRSYQPLGATKAQKPVTIYEYNTLDQLVRIQRPDEGEAWFKYRKDGQVRFSQNSQQAQTGRFSYTNYDVLGRPVESGVFVENSIFNFDPITPNGLDAIVDQVYSAAQIENDSDDFINTACEQQLYTVYDVPDVAGLSNALGARTNEYPIQSFVSGKVSKTYSDESTSWYSYDAYGRVSWLVQTILGLGTKTIDYEYHPITGSITKVYYQKDQADQFIHKYDYNAKNQLIKVETSIDGIAYLVQAEYQYYETGGVKRAELAEGAQGIDYVYNLYGQLKAINHPTLQMSDDPGGDDNDLFGMQLDYYINDFARNLTNIGNSTFGVDRLNGNVKGIRWNSSSPDVGESEYIFSYDRNNWLVGANFDPGTQGGGISQDLPLSGTITNDQLALSSITISSVATISGTVTLRIDTNGGSGAGDYDVNNITYDANGNIQSLLRRKGSQNGNNAMDDLTYVYRMDKPNQLLRVDDANGDVSNADDIGDQDGDNYVYNSIGQLTNNLSEGISYIYNASGLVTEVAKNGQLMVKFFYNDRNHRIKKESYTNGVLANTTYYIRDVAGQVMAIYDDRSGGMHLAEQPIYGKGRLGVVYTAINNTKNYLYELADHLGNVRAVFTIIGNGAQLESYTDYYPYGMSMPGRGMLGPEGYRYAFQGQERDAETGKEAFELRLWDSRIGRWLSPDPSGEFVSPYIGMANNPTNEIDPDGGCTDCSRCPDACMKAKVTTEDIQKIGSLDIVSLKLVPYKIEHLDLVTLSLGGGIEANYNAWFDYYVQGFGDYQRWEAAEIHRREFAASLNQVGKDVGKVLLVIAAPVAISVVGPALAGEGLITFTTQNAGRNALMNVGQQLIAKNGHIGEINVVEVGLSAVTQGVGSSVIGSVVEVRLNGDYSLNADVTSIVVDVVAGKAINRVHTKIDGVLPDDILSPSGEVYKFLLQTGAAGVINSASNRINE